MSRELIISSTAAVPESGPSCSGKGVYNCNVVSNSRLPKHGHVKLSALKIQQFAYQCLNVFSGSYEQSAVDAQWCGDAEIRLLENHSFWNKYPYSGEKSKQKECECFVLLFKKKHTTGGLDFTKHEVSVVTHTHFVSSILDDVFHSGIHL